MNKVAEAMSLYDSGLSVAQVGKKIDLSTGKTFYLLRDGGCVFRRKGVPVGYKHSPEAIEKISIKNKGKTMRMESRHKISEARNKHFDGIHEWGHRKIHENGYVLVYAPDHPAASKDGYVLEHRLVVERSIGRMLTPDEVVHHKDHNKSNNQLENLQLMTTHDHMSMHMRERHLRRRNDLLTR